ncbi:hypothetical protein CLU79DRAFT_705069, partial [Phycomyces nitens]
PIKLPLWQNFWQLHFGFVPQTTDIHNALYLFQFPPPLDTTLQPNSILGSVLLAMWRHHWGFIFDKVPFLATNAVTTATSLLSCLHAKEHIDQCHSPV